MIKKIEKNLKTLLFVLIVLLFAVVLLLFSVDIASKNTENISDNNNTVSMSGEKRLYFSVPIKLNDGENAKEYEIHNVSEQTTVFDILKEVSLKNDVELEYNNNYSFGVFIESIGGIKNGDDGKYWQYYINEVLGDVAADKKTLKEGDNVEWRFEDVNF